MMRTRIVVGLLMAGGMAGVLLGDRHLAPWYPVMAGLLGLVSVLAAVELVRLFPAAVRPPIIVAVPAVLTPIVAAWYTPVQVGFVPALPAASSAWEPILFALTAVLMAAILVELARYQGPGAAVQRLALTAFAAVYLGVLGSVLARLRWLDADGFVLALAVFVPKAADVGALFAGRAFGRHRMTPLLSPKKTWEGLAGGLLLSAGTAAGFHAANPVFAGGLLEASAFGLVVGGAGVLGDLAVSLVKRDAGAKDASNTIPGFGGVLDVIDSVLFAAPVVYLWFRFTGA